MTLLGIIPARGGSKGIPRKNIKHLCGRPLIAWTIEAAGKSKLLDRFVVSTEDVEIAETARAWGAEVLERPVELAGDTVISREVIRHALEATGADVSVLLQPTSPVRDDYLIDRAIVLFLEGGYDSLATGFMNPVYPPHGQEHRRQDISETFVNDGSVVISTRDTIMSGSLFGKNAGIMVTDREQNVDIDEEFDFWLAERVLEKRLNGQADSRPSLVDQASLDHNLLEEQVIRALEMEVGVAAARRVAREAFRGFSANAWS
jgi:CMP-N-acetylneuraminic acid synthetase